MARKKPKAAREVSAGGIVFRRQPDGSARFLLLRDPYKHWGFPKGHLEDGESPAQAAGRETEEETGLSDLSLHGPIRIIDWHFRFKGRYIHKFCHFFLFESRAAAVVPQLDEGITDYRWLNLEEALRTLSYDNARGVLKRAGEMARTLVAVGAGRPPRPGRTPAAANPAEVPELELDLDDDASEEPDHQPEQALLGPGEPDRAETTPES